MASIPKTMRACQLVGFHQKYEIRDIPVPIPGPNDLLIKTGAAGFCHTDYQVWEGVYESPLPMTGSHEPVGTVVAIGSSVKGWRVGQRVGVLLFRHQCHVCTNCRTTNDIRFCEQADYAGLKADGGFAEYVIGDAENCVELPEGLEFVQAAPLMCAGATVWSGIQACLPASGLPIGIIGIGGLGSLAVQFAKALGHPVVAIDNRPEGLSLAVEASNPSLNADLVIDSRSPNALSDIKKWAGGSGLPAVVCCTDDVSVIEWGLELLRPQGVYVPLGLPTESLRFDSFTLIFKELTIKGSVVSTRKEAQDMLRCVHEHGVRNHLTVVEFGRSVELPELYMNKHLKGRLVVRY
ncbi:alcohol dehydrogenase GroES-like domain-containing protein [Lophiostoma macrostomum CBS 122681]|uniref:Alcohol dehydrogenase GroES-like domain-containing protein n=1 Tax=Lophiostoma macrostomum CBS 122681 TaxID=1314788 RepID=A0A6A6SWW8_9PLEO|nr:alcohol dehydrogenase GroES-like domain-containing protein [Lophiostoma macrostomum CBS 122681]